MPQVLRQPAIIWSAIHAKSGHVSVWRWRSMLVAIACLWPFLAGAFLAGSAGATTWIDGNKAHCRRLIKLLPAFQPLKRLLVRRGFMARWKSPSIAAPFIRPKNRRKMPLLSPFVIAAMTGLPQSRFFSGWIFSSSPAISALEHPVYDLTLLACFAD